jgi:hypothetical protein
MRTARPGPERLRGDAAAAPTATAIGTTFATGATALPSSKSSTDRDGLL